MKKVFLSVNETKPGIEKNAQTLVKWLRGEGVEVFFDRPTAKLLKKKASNAKDVELYIALGGDGTLLKLVRQVQPTETPFVGINAGWLGFLAEIKIKNMKSALSRVLSGKYEIDRRMALLSEVETEAGKFRTLHSLNDVVVSGIRGRLITLDVHVNEEYLNSYRADGIIISTPTGSTAYSLSAGGPIVNPKLNAIVITPVCPHTMTNRPIILPADSVLKIFVSGKARNEVKVIADGQIDCMMGKDSVLVVKRAVQTVNLVTPGKNSFYGILREKLNWR